MLVVRISKEGYHTRVVLPNLDSVIKVSRPPERHRDQAIHNILQSYRPVYSNWSSRGRRHYEVVVTLYNLSENDVDLIQEVTNKHWSFAADIAKRIGQNDRLITPTELEEDIIIEDKHFRGSIFYPKGKWLSMWRRNAIEKYLQEIYSFSVFMPNHLNFKVLRPDIDNIDEIFQRVMEEDWRFAKHVYKDGWAEACEWRKHLRRRKERVSDKRKELRGEVREKDAMVVCRTDWKRTVYYKGMRIGSAPIQTGHYFSGSFTYHGNKAMHVKYSLLETLRRLPLSKRENIMDKLKDKQEAIENGTITGDNLMAVISITR